MSLQVTILRLSGLRSKGERYAKITFRNQTYSTGNLEECDSEIRFNEVFEWRIGSNIKEHETLAIDVFTYNKVFSDRLIGRFKMVLQQVAKTGDLSLTEALLDSNNTALKTFISIAIKYMAPDGTVGSWFLEDFSPHVSSDTISFSTSTSATSKHSLLQPLLTEQDDKSNKTKSLLSTVISRSSKQRSIDINGLTTSNETPLEPSRKSKAAHRRAKVELDNVSVASMTMLDTPVTNKRSKPDIRFECGAAKVQNFQVAVTIIEANHLSSIDGNPIDPVVLIQIGDDKKYTAQKEATDCPYYNEVFVFDYHVLQQVLFDKILTLSVIHPRKLLRSGKLLGRFKIDLETIHEQPDHNFYHKWAILTDPDDLNTVPKGYLKVNISVVGKGDSFNILKTREEDEGEIENNLLLPEGIQADRQRALYSFKIYKAEGLPKMSNSITEKLKTVLQGEARDLVNPFVEISFLDVKGRTSVRKSSYEPCWNEEIFFTELFPPLCKRIKVQIRDKDSLNNTVIGTAYIELEKISNSGEEGFLPTFGPTYVNMYGSPRNYTLVNEHSSLNEGLGEGVAFRGRLLMAFSVELIDLNAGLEQGSADVEVEEIPALSELGTGKLEEFFLFGSILDADMISKNMSDKPITFEVSVGNYGNEIDGANFSWKRQRSEVVESDGSLNGSDTDEAKSLLRGSSQNLSDSNIRSLTPRAKPLTSDNYYYHMPYFEQKPCVYLTSQWHDRRKRLYNSNIMQKVVDKLMEGIEDVEEMIITDEDRPDRRLRGVAEELVKGCASYIKFVKGTGGVAVGRTKLDQERHKLCLREMELIGEEAMKIKTELKLTTLQEKLVKIRSLLAKVKFLCDDPQHTIPDVFVWMLSGQKRVGYARVPARKILYSVKKEECGIHCAKIQTIFLKLPGKRNLGPSGWDIQAKLDIYLWLGHMKHRRNSLNGLPQGYEITRSSSSLNSPPIFLTYKDREQFELRAHIYQGRNLLPADETGLSDPFVKVVFSIHASITQVAEETLNPTWDETLITPKLTLYGSAKELREDPPVAIIEIFDKDVMGKEEYMGRTVAKPIVKISSEKYRRPRFPAKLDWYQIYRGSSRAGEILASFELLHIPYDNSQVDNVLTQIWNETNKGSNNDVFETKVEMNLERSSKVLNSILTDQGHKFTVPKGIRPVLARHRIEVLFWGMRGLKKLKFISVDHPRVTVEIAGSSVTSRVLCDYRKNPNFSEPVQFIEDVYLPEVEYWCPPITITAVDCRAFGRSILIGTHAITNISKFIHRHSNPSKTATGLTGKQLMNYRAEETVINIGPEPTQQSNGIHKVSKNTIKEEENKKKEEDQPLDEAAVDWWSKYFASKEALLEQAQEYINDAHRDALNEYGNDKANAPPSDENALNTCDSFYSGRDYEGKSSKVGKKLLSGAVGAVKHAKKKLATPMKRQKDEKLINFDKLKIFETELENVPDFSGFNDLLHSFDLCRGKLADELSACAHKKRTAGSFKGNFKIYRYPLPPHMDQSDPQIGLFKGLPSNEPIRVLVRVYVIRAIDLHPTDPNGKADPYVVISIGNHKVNDKENYISKQLNPMFGKTFDFEATFPMESMLTIQIYDWDLLTSDDLIGETKLDLENRFYSKHRAACGVAEKYSLFGYNQWKDPMTPCEILEKLCRDHSVDGPHYSPGRVRVGGRIYRGSKQLQDEDGHTTLTNEHAALVALRHWKEIPKVGFALVPEHVETRPIFCPDKPGIEQGRVEVWVDMFPMDLPLPGPPVDVTPRKPKSFELRVIIWNTDDVICVDDDFFTGDKMSDIYVKGWFTGDDKQDTDIHYRSLTGEGNFNWRFLFPFEYMVAEEKVVVTKKESIFSWDETEFKIPPKLYLQIWDADHFSSDDFLGSLTLDLTRLPRGAKSSNKCNLYLASDEDAGDKEDGPEVPMISLFKQRRIKGWWPFTAKNDQDELELTGKLEAEIILMTVDDAEKNPAGLGREEPDPLEKPNRPDTSFVWFMNPLKSFRYLICTRFKWLIIKLSILLLLVALIVLFIYSSPSWFMKKILGA